MNYKYRNWRRHKFLNLISKSSLAQIITHIEEPKGNYPEAAVEISDCSGTVRLHGSLKDEGTVKNFLFKLNTLIDELTKFRDYIQKVTQPKAEDE